MTSLSVFHYLMSKDLLSGYKAAFCVSSGRNSLVWRSQEGQVAYFYVTALSFMSNRRQRVGRMDIVMVYGTMLQLPALRKEEPKQALGAGVAFCWGLWNFCSILHVSWLARGPFISRSTFPWAAGSAPCQRRGSISYFSKH